MGIFIIKNGFIVFQSIYTLALKPFDEAVFPLRLRHRQNMVLTASSRDENR